MQLMSCSVPDASHEPTLETVDAATLSRVHGGYSPELFAQMQKAVGMGLTINSTWTGFHGQPRPGNSHYDGRAFDSIGTQQQMWNFYNHAAKNTTPNELIFRDRFIKDGKRIGGIGGHNTHVHFSLR
jgi:hypothetical protein